MWQRIESLDMRIHWERAHAAEERDQVLRQPRIPRLLTIFAPMENLKKLELEMVGPRGRSYKRPDLEVLLETIWFPNLISP